MSNIVPAIKQIKQKPTKPDWLDLKVFKRANDFTYTDKSEEYRPGPPDRNKFPFHNAPWEQGNFLIRKDEPYFDSEDVQEEESDFDRGRKTAAVDVRKLTKIYEDQAKGIPLDPADVYDVLYELGRYFFDYLEWYDTYDIELRPGEEQIIKNFEDRREEIDTALASKDVNQQIIAIDNAINTVHIDMPILVHLSIDAGDVLDFKSYRSKEEFERATEELEELWSKFFDLLESLGKLPKQAKNEDFFQFTPEDVRVQPYLNKPDVLKEREEKFQKFPKYPKEDITERDLSFAE